MDTETRNKEEEITPIGDRVLCRRIEDKEEEKDGIIIPQMSQQESDEAIVVAVGPGTMMQDGSIIPLSVVPGMKVIMPKYGGAEVKIGDQSYQILHEKELQAVIGKVEKEEEV